MRVHVGQQKNAICFSTDDVLDEYIIGSSLNNSRHNDMVLLHVRGTQQRKERAKILTRKARLPRRLSRSCLAKVSCNSFLSSMLRCSSIAWENTPADEAHVKPESQHVWHAVHNCSTRTAVSLCRFASFCACVHHVCAEPGPEPSSARRFRI